MPETNQSGAGRMLPASILGAGALIGLGLFFGLRDRTPPAPPTASSTGPSATAPVSGSAADPASASSGGPTASASGVVPAPSVAPSARLTAALASLETQRKDVVERCVKPSLEKQPTPPRVRVTFNVTFGPDGAELSRGIVEDRKNERPGVGACIQQALKPLRVQPGNETTRVDLPWDLP